MSPLGSPSGSGSTSASEKPPVNDGSDAACKRVCVVQTKCGGDPKMCSLKCLPIARVLQGEVVEAMVSCVEKKGGEKPGCDDDSVLARKRLAGECVLEATSTKKDSARANIELFAKAYCEASATCGNASGTVGVNECLGEARGAILATEGDSSGGLYGSIRSDRIDEMLKCFHGPCDQRKTTADAELERCLDATLAKAAEAP